MLSDVFVLEVCVSYSSSCFLLFVNCGHQYPTAWLLART